jgi:anti-anti-sigma factor
MATKDRIVRDSSDGGELTLSLSYDESVFLIELYGELDLASAPELEQVIERAEDTDAAEILIDLSGLKFIDSTGISLLTTASARSSDGRLKLLRATGQVERVLKLCGLDEKLPFID